MPATRRQKYVVGIGSQRAGSTLLAQLLDDCTPVYIHPQKELHYFDTVAGNRPLDWLRDYLETNQRIAEQRSAGLAGLARQAGRRVRDAGRTVSGRGEVVRASRIRERNQRHTTELILSCASAEDLARIPYVDLFAPAAGTYPMVGEITPEYQLLDGTGVARMRAVVGADARIILLRRDPVRRILSSFVLLRGYLKSGEVEASQLDEEGLLDMIEEDGLFIRQQYAFSDYDTAARRYREYFDNVLEIEMADLIAGDDAVRQGLAHLLGVHIDRRRYTRAVSTRFNSFGDPRFSDELVSAVERGFADYLNGASD